MISTHDSLRLLRTQFAGNKHVYHATAYLRRVIFATETDLAESLDISSQACKALLAQMYQAGLVSLGSSRLYQLTPKAEALSDRLGITSLAVQSVLNDLDLAPVDRSLLASHLSDQEERMTDDLGDTLARYQAISLAAVWRNSKARPDLLRRALEVVTIGLSDDFQRVGPREFAKALSQGRTSHSQFTRRCFTIKNDATLCDDFILSGDLPSASDARTVVLMVALSRMFAVFLSPSTAKKDRPLSWMARNAPEVGRSCSRKLVRWDAHLVESSLSFALHRGGGPQEYEDSRDALADAFYSASMEAVSGHPLVFAVANEARMRSIIDREDLAAPEPQRERLDIAQLIWGTAVSPEIPLRVVFDPLIILLDRKHSAGGVTYDPKTGSLVHQHNPTMKRRSTQFVFPRSIAGYLIDVETDAGRAAVEGEQVLLPPLSLPGEYSAEVTFRPTPATAGLQSNVKRVLVRVTSEQSS